MALSAVHAVVKAKLAEGWAHCPVRELNEMSGDTFEGGGPFLVVQYPVATSSPITFGAPGSNLYRDEGAIRFRLFVEQGSGVDTALAWIDELAALFRGKHFDGGVRTYAPSQPVVDDRNEDGVYFSLSISVPFDHDVTG